MIPRNKLGHTDIEISCIGLGTVKFGRNQGVKYPQAFDLPSDTEIDSLLMTAKSLGINFIDTAPAYGNSEERVGQWLKKTGERHTFVIATKFGEKYSEGISTFDFSPQAAFLSIDESLRRLQTDYLDIVLVHSNGEDEKIINEYNVFDTLYALKKAGKIRAYGMSTKTIAGGLLAVEKSDVAMITYNLAERAEQSIISYAYERGKGILIKKALASGHITQLSTEGNPIEKAINFSLSPLGVSAIVIGTLKVDHLKDIVNVARNAIMSRQKNEPFRDINL